jgi:ferritin-like metal-binding protein YciE
METAHELFIHELNDILDGEKRLVEALSEQEQDSGRPELKKAFAAHRAQTEKQIERLQQVFSDIGEEPEETECHGIMGLIEEKKAFQEEDPSEELIDIFNVGAAVKVESYEINAYESLIRLAQQMGHRKAAQLLNQNLREEEQTLKKMESFSKKLKPSELGMEEEEEAPAPARRSGQRRGRRAA